MAMTSASMVLALAASRPNVSRVCGKFRMPFTSATLCARPRRKRNFTIRRTMHWWFCITCARVSCHCACAIRRSRCTKTRSHGIFTSSKNTTASVSSKRMLSG